MKQTFTRLLQFTTLLLAGLALISGVLQWFLPLPTANLPVLPVVLVVLILSLIISFCFQQRPRVFLRYLQRLYPAEDNQENGHQYLALRYTLLGLLPKRSLFIRFLAVFFFIGFFSELAYSQIVINLVYKEKTNKMSIPAGDVYTLQLDYSISSTTGNADGVVAVIDLPDEIFQAFNYMGTVHAPVGNFVFSNVMGAKKMTITFIPTVSSGSTGQLEFTVRTTNGNIPNGTVLNTTAEMTATGGWTSGPKNQSISVTAQSFLCAEKKLLSGGAIDNITTYNIRLAAQDLQFGNAPLGFLNITNLSVTDMLPAGAEFISATWQYGALSGTGVYSSPNITFSGLPDLNAAWLSSSWQVRVLDLVIKVKYNSTAMPPFMPGNVVTNNASLVYTPLGGTPITVNNGDVSGTCIVDLTQTHTLEAPTVGANLVKDGGGMVFPGQSFEYSYGFTNTGNVELENLEILETIPSNIRMTALRMDGAGAFLDHLEYQTNLNPAWTSIPPPYPAGSIIPAAPVGDYYTAIKFVFKSPFPANTSLPQYNTISFVPAGEVTMSEVVTNCMEWTSTTPGIPAMRQTCNSNYTLEPRPTTAKINYAVRHEPCSPVLRSLGDNQVFSLLVTADAGFANATDPIGAILVPVGFDYVPGSEVFLALNSGIMVAPTMELVPNYTTIGGTVYNMFRWTFPPGTVLPFGKEFQVKVTTTISGLITPGVQYTGIGLATSGNASINTPDYNNGNFLDTGDWDLDGNTTENFQRSHSAWSCFAIGVSASASMESRKWVKGQLDSEYHRYPETGLTVRGGAIDYRLVVKNTGNIPMKDIMVIDIFPFVGDMGVIDPSPRNTEWRPYLTGPIIAPSGITVYYSTAQNPCRDDFRNPGDPTPWPAGCTPANWSLAPPADITTVQSVMIDFGTLVLSAADSAEFYWPMRAPTDAPVMNEIAWNSFAFIASRTDNNQKLLAAEPIKVGIEVQAPDPASYGNYVWKDTNMDGIQNEVGTGLGGVRVDLYRDNGDNMADPGTDFWIGFTLTGSNGEYLFPNLDPGDYFAVFSPPAGCAVSPTDQGGNDALDSDGLITPITHLDALEVDLTWDLGLFTAPNCDVAITGFTVSACTYNATTMMSTTQVNVFVNWANAPAGENITVNIDGSNPQTINVVGGATSPAFVSFTVPSDGASHTINAFFATSTACKDSREIMAPLPCVPGQCIIDVVSATPSVCNNINDTYSLSVVINYSEEPTGNIKINVGGTDYIFTPDGLGPDVFNITGLTANGLAGIDVTASFVNKNTCTNTLVDAYDAPVTCSCVNPTSVVITETNVDVCGTGAATFNYTVSNGPATITTSNGTIGNFSTTTLNNGTGTFTYTPAVGEIGTVINLTATIGDPDGAGPCTGSSDNATVSSTRQKEAGTGSPTTICETSTSTITLSSLLTGADAGGTWTAGVANPSGGTFNAASGTFNPTGASVGAYTFKYSFAAGSVCPADETTVTVNVTEQKEAGTGNSTTICETSTTTITLSSLLTGADAGGTWTAGVANPSGGNFSAASGTFDPTGVSVGTYTFKYSFAAAGNCAADETTVTVIVTAQPEAGTGSTTTICETSTTTITLFSLITGGDAGGTWTAGGSNPSGGSFTAGTGTFDPTGATPGVYTFTYAFAAGGGCAADQTTVTVNVTDQREAGTGSSANICATSTTTIDLFGLLTGEDTGGTWTAGGSNPSGGTFTAASGTFDPTGAGVGTYTFKYSFAAVGNCVADEATVSIIVSAQPEAGSGQTTSICFTSTTIINLSTLLTGADANGVWSADVSNPVGGTFNASNGTFDPTNAGLGVFKFKYSFAAGGGCAADETTVTINIVNTPSVCPTDFGDLPQPPYATDLTNTGPSHIIITGLKIGTIVDAETDGQPNGTATGDGADEDGFNPALPANMLVAGQTTSVTIPVMNMTGGDAKLTVYLDFNDDGDLTDANEMFSTTVANSATTATLSIVVPVDAVLNTNIGARFRLTTSTTMAPTGLAPDGEVEDYLVQVMGLDYGDLADSGAGTGTSNYETQNANGGASHKIITDPTTGVVILKIGGSVDADTDGQQSATANGDDNATLPGTDDEDGVTLPMFVTGTSANITVPVMNMTGGDAKLVMFVDWNNDGDFADTDEMYSVTVPNNATTATLNGVTPPLTAVLNANFGIRFRLSNDPAFILNMSPNGPVTGGEVEDYIAQSMGFDYGDLADSGSGTGTAPNGTPANHETLNSDSGPKHKIVTDGNGAVTLKIGASVDDDANGQPSADAGKTAGGDDNTGTPDDEELEAYLATKLFIVTQNTSLDIPVMNMTGSTAKLTLFIDFNKDGDFTDSGEMFSDEVNSGETVANLTVTVPSYAVVGQDLGFRLRLAGVTDIMTPTGLAQSGEVEDYMIQVIGYDYGDLPTTYGTEDPNAPKHILDANLKLGASVDAELNGAPEAMAGAMTGGDDNTAGLVTFGTSNPANDDENGVVFVTPMVPGSQACIEVTAMNMNNTAAVLQMWIDWNGDGDILDAGEAVTTGSFNGVGGGAVVPATSGLTNAKLCFDVPAGAVFADGGAAFVRFRLSPSGGLAPNTQTGPVPFGEIEDYKVQLGKVGNLVFEDRDFDGTQDAGEPGIPGVTVSLTWVGPDGVLGGTDDVTYPTVQTDANGKYYFCGLTDGPSANDNQFKLVFSTPTNMTPTRTNQGGNDVKDSDGAVTLVPVMDLTMAMESFAFTFPTPTAENSTGDSGTPGVGNFDDNQTDETHDQGFALLDYGDLPETGNDDDFSTTMTKGGAIHVITPGFKLGASIDGERDGAPSADASGDGADEDGVTFISPLIPGSGAWISVVSMNPFSSAVLQGWIDWNNNGQLEAGEELAFTSSAIPSGTATTTFKFPVPADAIFNDGMVFARFRLSPTGGLNANGPDKYGTDPVPQGEVEDYKLNVVKVGNLVWEDYDFDGIQDAGEPGIGGQTVQLVWGGPDGDVTTTSDNETYNTATLTAAAGGNIVGEYYFCGLIEGTYKLVALTPTDMTPSKSNQGDQTNGGLTDNDGIQTGTDLTMIMTAPFTITPANLTTQPTGENSTGDNGTAGVGTFPDNQTNETYDFAFVSVDFGDLPDSYTTNDDPNDSGAQHVIQPGKYLGTCVDSERDAAVDAVAGLRGAGDDGAASTRTQGTCTTPNDDENGVEFLTPLVPGYEACVRVTYTALDQPGLTRDGKTYLSAWIDYNGNGQFDSGEQVITDASLAVGTGVVRTFCFTVPNTATFAGGAIRTRFRLHCEPGLGSAGVAIGGEVEDYHLPIAKVGNYAWYDNDLRGDQTTTDNPRNFADEKGANGLSLVLVWYGPDGQFDTDDDRLYIKQTASGTQGELEDEGGTADGIYYFCGLQEGSFRIVPLKYATPTNVGATTVTTMGGTVYNIADAAKISDGTTTSIREEFEISRKMLTRANNVGDDELDSDTDPVLSFSIPNLVADGLITGENGVGDVPTVYNYPDTLTNLSLDLGLIQEPNIEIVQSVVGVDKAASKDCDNFNMIVDVCIKNTGISADGTMGVPLNNIQASIDLAGQLGAIFKGMVGKPVLIKTAAERKYAGDPLVDPQGFPVLNPNFNGSSNQNLFDGISGLLWPGEKILVRYVIEVAPNDVDMMTAVNAKWSATTNGAAVNYQGQPILNYYQGGIQYIAQDSSNDARTIEGGYYDADEPTPFGDCWKKVKQTVTMTTVNIGLHADCKLNVLPTMLIEPYYPECDTVGLPLGGFYRFIFADMNGKPLPNPIDARCLAQMKAKYLLELVGVCEPRWGEINFEDKAGPNIVSAVFAPDSILCKDVNLILNNPKSIGLPGADFRSPRQNERTFGTRNITLVNDELMNLGMVDFRENCDCDNACAVTVKWTDKLVTYDCDSINQKGVWGRIYREWVATDCRGMHKDTVQVIVIKRPAVDAFKFVNTTRTGVKTQTGTAAGAPNYDWTVEYNNCSADKALIKKADWMPSLLSKFHNPPALPLRHYLDEIECNYSVQIKDTEFPICGGKGLKIDRELYVFDWCAGGIVDTFHILIKIGDFEAPSLEYAHHAPNALSTGPMDCTAAFPISAAGIKSTFGVAVIDNCGVANVSVRVKTKDRYVKGILVATNTWEQVEYAVMNGMMTGLPVGRHRLIIDAYDGCYNATRDSFEFEVVDKIAPVMKCDDDLHVTLSNANGYTNGYAQVNAANIDEGSWDNCKLAWVRVRRNVPENCTASFIAKGYDSNGNGKLDPMPADGDWTKADGFDINGDGDLADFGETFILKEGKLMTPLQDIVEFFCCDLSERVTIELWGEDTNGNRNFCWNDLLLEDKVTPTCIAPWDVTIYCDDKGLEKIDDRTASAAIWGDVTVSSGADCAALDIVYSTVKSLKCGAGYIDRIWTLTKQTVKGPITITCKQRIKILPVHEYNICFPKDISTDCKTPIIDTVIIDELGCDILAVNVTDKRYDASDDECYKIFRTYSVINWCTYDDRCGDPLEQTNISIIDRAVFGNYGKAPIYLLVRDRENNRRDGIEEFYISKDLVHANADDIRVYPPYCSVAEEFYHSFIYTQIIKVYDEERPVVTGIQDTFCTDPAACSASITKVVTIKDNCTDKVELERQMLMIAPFQTLDAGKMIMYATPRWSVKELSGGQFEIKVSNLPEGTHDLIVVGRDECGNLSVATRIPFVVKDCKAPAPICINGLSTELMPDGNGGGMMAVWASDFVASKIYDCNGQGTETKDGLKLVTKYSINRVGSPVVATQTGLNLTCADAGKTILVELHAWDEAGNHDFCVSFVEVQDNRKVCGGNATLGEISGVITTDDLKPVLGVNVDLSGGAQMNQNTGSNGVYSFGNLAKGSDYTVSPQLDKDHINGVSTFDLVQIQKHILGIKALDNPYRLIAADVNNSKSITTLDMIQIRKLILNIDTKFTSVPSWKFVDASYQFPDPSNPWSAQFPEVANVNDLDGKVKADFIAVKMGDVNGNASASGAVATETRSDKTMIISTEEQQLQSGQSYTVVFKAKDLAKIQGYQFTLSIDPSLASIEGIDYTGAMKPDNFGIFTKNGMITTSFVRAPLAGAQTGSAAGETMLFTLKLKAESNTALSRALILNSRLTNMEAYNQSDEVMGVQLAFGAEAAAERAALRQNVPNPFVEETLVGFYLPVATKAVLTIRDVKGALIYRVEGNYAKGNNQVILKKNDLGASGVLYYTLETSDFTATKKMVVLQK